MKNSGLFLNMAKWCFLGLCFFEGFNVIVVCFWCVWHGSRSVKMLVFFSQFLGAFVGWFILVYLGFGRFRCFCVSCVCFCFLCCFCFCFVCFVFVLLLDCFLVLFFCFCFFLYSLFSFVFLFLFFLFLFFFCFVFLEGLRVRWGGPKGPPHLALNPPYFFCFCFFCCFDFFGGFKGLWATSLGPKPSLFSFCFWYFWFLLFFSLLSFLVFYRQKYLFSPKKRAFFVNFSVSPFVSL